MYTFSVYLFFFFFFSSRRRHTRLQGDWSSDVCSSDLALPVEYEGALLEGLNARAVLARDVQVVAGRNAKLDARAALERARALGADHAIVVDVRVSADEPIFCRGSRRPLRAPATVWSHSDQVLRTSDGATRLTIADDAGLAITDWDVDCDDPRASRRLPTGEAVASAVARLLTRVVGP